MKQLTEAEKIIVSFTEAYNLDDSISYHKAKLLQLGKILIAEQKPKPVFPVDGWSIFTTGTIEQSNGCSKQAVLSSSEQGNTAATRPLAEKEVLRRAARARCIEKIADCENNAKSIVFYAVDGNVLTSYDYVPSVEKALVCNNFDHSQTLLEDKQFTDDYKLYLGVSDE